MAVTELFTGDTIEPTTLSALTTVANLGLRPTGALAETFSRMPAAMTAQTLTTANAVYTAIELVKGVKVTNLNFVSGSTALATGTHAFAGLYSAALAQLAVSADGTSTAWSANSARAFAMATPYTVPVSGIYYVALAIVASTTPTVAGVASIAVEADLTPSVAFVDTSNTISTTMPTTATNSAGSNPLYCYVS